MHIALIGASGRVGLRILAELLARGHKVTAIVRNPARVPASPNVTALKGDILDPIKLATQLVGHSAIVSSVPFTETNPHNLLKAVRTSGVQRYLVVGGAGSLFVAPGKQLLTAPEFPDGAREEASKGAAYLALLREEIEINWTFLSPSANFAPGVRTGRFRLGKDDLLTSENGSRISFEDYAVALADEIEAPAHLRARFTVGY